MNFQSAKCEPCPLGQLRRRNDDFTPVPAEIHAADEIVIIGEAPGSHEEFEGRPFVGPSGSELQAALDASRIPRETCRITNVLACRPPMNRLDRMTNQLSRRNAQRKRDGKSPVPTPQSCCEPRVSDDIQGFKQIICLGALAASAIRGGAPSIMGIRGACEEIEMPWGVVKVGYTLHPSFVLRSPKWREVFQKDINKIYRYFSGDLNWVDPEIQIVSTLNDVRIQLERLSKAAQVCAYDVETDARNPLEAKLRCIGFSNDDLSVLIPILGIDGKTSLLCPGEEEEIKALVSDFLRDCPVPLIGHNAGQYDRLVCEETLGVSPKLATDTLLLHLLADNEMPHRLGFVSSHYTDFIEAWKADHTAVNARDDEELHIYCAKDCCVTARIAAPLAQVVKRRSQWHLIEREHALQWVGVGMQRLGMRVDLPRLQEHELDFERKLQGNKDICKDILSDKFNPNSTLQLRKLLFTEWDLTPEKYNEKTGDPSTDDDTLRKMITHHNLEEEQKQLIQAVRMTRRYGKLLSTYVRPLRDRLILADGRVHPSYNRLPATGRYSSSEPNAQNIPAFFRDIFIPEEGHVFVGADMDQLELRLIAEEATAQGLLKTINAGLDPHNENMEVVYGKSIWTLDGAPKDRKKKGKGTFKRTRGITKNVFYAWQYAASVPTIHQQVISVEDDDGALIYAHLTHRDVRDVVQGLKKAVPEIPKWWEYIRQKYRREGFIADSLWGRRRDFKDEEKINELVNHPIQSGGASIVHEAMLELVTGTPGESTRAFRHFSPGSIPRGLLSFNFTARTGLVNQCHDSLLFEVKEEDAEQVKKFVGDHMTRTRRSGALLSYTAEAEVGMNWLEV